MVSLWTSIPIKSVLDCAMVDLRVFWVDVATSSGMGFGKLTRVTSGVNLPPLEVIMSRRKWNHNMNEREKLEIQLLEAQIKKIEKENKRTFFREFLPSWFAALAAISFSIVASIVIIWVGERVV